MIRVMMVMTMMIMSLLALPSSRSVTGHMETIMAGLCCGVPSVQGWPILR